VQVDRTGALEASTADIPSSRREAQAQQIDEGKDDFGGYMDSQDPHSRQGRARL